jgi:hypothetical protein
MIAVLSVLGAVLLWILKLLLWLLMILVLLLALVLLCPFCADIRWQASQGADPDAAGTLQIKAGVCGITFPVMQWPKPEPPAEPQPPKGLWGKLKARVRAAQAKRKAGKQAQKASTPQKPKAPRKKIKLTVNAVCAILRGAGRLMRAVFGALRLTRIRVCLAVRGEDAAAVGRNYGRANAWLYASLGFLDRMLYLDFDELRLEPDFGNRTEAERIDEHVSLRVSARLLFIVLAAIRVFIELWREKVLDIFV